MSENEKFCPGCGRHCNLVSPGCPRGEAYAKGEELPAGAGSRYAGERGPHGPRMHDREREHSRMHKGSDRDHVRDEDMHHERPHDGEERRERHDHREHHPRIIGTEQYDLLDIDEKLTVAMREFGHRRRPHPGGRESQSRILQILASEGVMTQRDLTEKLGIQPGSASEVIGKLERAGYLERKVSESDRRTADLYLTDAGRSAAESIPAVPSAPFAVLSEEEKTQFLTILEKLLAE